MERVLKVIDDMESDIDNIDVEAMYHYYIIEYDGINNAIILSIVEAYDVYNSDTDIYETVERADTVEVIRGVSNDMFINFLIDYINTETYNSYDGLIRFKGFSLY